jgi:hypothetical protein
MDRPAARIGIVLDCSEVRAALLENRDPFDPRLEAHVGRCPACSELLAQDAALGRLLAVAKHAHPPLAEGNLAVAVARDLERDDNLLGRLRGLRTGQRIALAAAVAVLPVLMLAVDNPRALSPERWRTVAYGVGLVVAIASLLAPLTGSLRARLAHQAVIATLAIGVRSILLVLPGSSTAPELNSSWECFAIAMLSSAPAFVLLHVIARERSFSCTQVALVGGITGLIASMALQLHCIDKRMEHLVLAHGLIAFVWIACGLLILQRLGTGFRHRR